MMAFPETEKPPFFPKQYPTNVGIGGGLPWLLARKNATFAHMFRGFYTPRSNPFVVFKEVARTQELLQLLYRTDIPIVYLVRHPCAVIASLLKGQAQDLMPSLCPKVVVRDSVEKYATPDLAAICEARWESLTIAETEAILWRLAVERELKGLQETPMARSLCTRN